MGKEELWEHDFFISSDNVQSPLNFRWPSDTTSSAADFLTGIYTVEECMNEVRVLDWSQIATEEWLHYEDQER